MSKSPRDTREIIVIGAGIAGLAATHALARQGCRVTLIEARDRLGGRINSIPSPNVPIELGAEFIHGGTAEIKRWLRRAGLKPSEVNTPMWWHDASGLQPCPDYWERIGRIAGKIPARNRGWSFAEFIRRTSQKFPCEDLALTTKYVGSFNAAPTSEISAFALRAERAGADTTDLILNAPYHTLTDTIARTWPQSRVHTHLRTRVIGIRWQRGSVEVTARDQKKRIAHFHARAALITLPLGVLKSRDVKFSPSLRAKQSLIRKLGWGHVARISLVFKKGFWSAPFMPPQLGARQGRAFGFINSTQTSFPVWWALHAPAPILTAWAGGREARSLVRQTPSRWTQAALTSLAKILNTSVATLRPWLQHVHAHNWSHDPLARGAYSYPVAGLEHGAERLAQPVARTFFFAGEATADDPGTVHGALASGLRAAREIIARST